jgi:hypothetical protein
MKIAHSSRLSSGTRALSSARPVRLELRRVFARVPSTPVQRSECRCGRREETHERLGLCTAEALCSQA